MLTGSKTTFKVRQMLPDIKVRFVPVFVPCSSVMLAVCGLKVTAEQRCRLTCPAVIMASNYGQFGGKC